MPRARKPLRGQPAAAPPRAPWSAVALIIGAGICTYWNGLGGPMIWDDQTAIVGNTTIRALSTAWVPPHETPVAGRPLANVSFALNYALGGLDVTGYHLVNV